MSTKLSGYNKKAIFYAKTTHLCYNIQKIGFIRPALYRELFMLAIAVSSPRVCHANATFIRLTSTPGFFRSLARLGCGVVLYNKLKSRVFEKQ